MENGYDYVRLLFTGDTFENLKSSQRVEIPNRLTKFGQNISHNSSSLLVMSFFGSGTIKMS